MVENPFYRSTVCRTLKQCYEYLFLWGSVTNKGFFFSAFRQALLTSFTGLRNHLRYHARSSYIAVHTLLCFFNFPCSVSFCRFLCLKNKTSASVVFTTYTQKHPSIEKGPPFVQPLLNFIWFLLLAVDGYGVIFLTLVLVFFFSCFWDYIFGCFLSRGKLTVFTVLCEQYQPSLKRDPMYNEVSYWKLQAGCNPQN